MMFGCTLPYIPIELSNARTYVGVCVYKKRRTLLLRTEHYDFRMRFSRRFDLPQEEIEDTIIHEMIHYYIAYNKIKDTSAHGKRFREIMNDINSRFNRHLTISHKLSKEEREGIIDQQLRWHVVALVQFHNGKTGIKVLPRNKIRIRHYRDCTSAHPDIKSVELFLLKDNYFNRYPISSALNVFFIDEATARKQLEGAKPLVL